MSYKSILASAAVLAAVVGTTGVVANADSTLPAATSTTKKMQTDLYQVTQMPR